METNEVSIKTEEVAPQSLIKLALEKGAPIEQLEKLMALQERWEKMDAEKKFNLAMASFQKECPIIEKQSSVKDKNGKERYKFAPIGEIVSQTKDFIAKNDLFYDFTTEDMNDFIKVICTVTHSAGHSKATTFKIPIGKEEYMSDVQKYGARLTFGKRYAFCNAFGIITGDEDTDAGGGEEKTKEIEKAISESETVNDLKIIWDSNVSIQKETFFVQAINKRKTELSSKEGLSKTKE